LRRLVEVAGGQSTSTVAVLAFKEPSVEFGFSDGQRVPTGTMAEPVSAQRFAQEGQVAL
jgi:hypothetical protein